MDNYYNILWIDDFDDSSSKGFDPTSKKPVLSALLPPMDEIGGRVKLVKSFLAASEEIKKRHTQFDAVIFDINMEKNSPPLSRLCQSDIYKKLHFDAVYIDEDDPNINDEDIEKAEEKNRSELLKIQKCSGYYLYLYLLHYGFPPERTCMFSAYVDDDDDAAADKKAAVPAENAAAGDTAELRKQLESKFMASGINPPKAIGKGSLDCNSLIDNPKMKNWILSLYSSTSKSYYRIRRLVFQACEYWKEKLSGELKVADKIPFNSIYYKGKSGIESAVFINDMLDSIKMMFPVIEPSEPERIYYQAMRTASNFHEESANIRDMTGDGRKYHSVVRNFRNWSSHNKLKDKTLEGRQFALLFCIALRTYFVDYSLAAKDDLLVYEKYFYDTDSAKFTYDDAKRNTLEIKWRTLISKVEIKLTEKTAGRQAPEDLSFDKLLYHIGTQNSYDRDIPELLLGLFDIITDKPVQKSFPPKFSSNYSITFEYNPAFKKSYPELDIISEHLFLNEAYELIK